MKHSFLFFYSVGTFFQLTNVKYVKYKKKTKNDTVYCSTDTSSTMDIHGLLETRGETRCLGWVSVYLLFIKSYHQCPRHSLRHVHELKIYCNYWIAARNNWNRKNVILKFSRACAGSCLVAKYFGRLRLNRCVLRESKFTVSKMIQIVILWTGSPFLF